MSSMLTYGAEEVFDGLLRGEGHGHAAQTQAGHHAHDLDAESGQDAQQDEHEDQCLGEAGHDGQEADADGIPLADDPADRVGAGVYEAEQQPADA
jgi:hypothetical protein